MTKQNKLYIKHDYGWRTVISLRKTDRALIIRQNNLADKNLCREIYLDKYDVDKLKKFLEAV